MTEFKQIILGIAITTLLAFLLITASIDAGKPYGKDVSELTGDKSNYSAIGSAVRGIEGYSQGWKTTFSSQEEGQGITSQIATEIVSISLSLLLGMFNVVLSPFTILIYTMSNLLTIPPEVTGFIVFVVLISVIFGIYKLIKQGE